MNKVISLLFFFVFVALIALSIIVIVENFNLRKEIYQKEKNISSQDSLIKINSKIIKLKDDIIYTNDQIINDRNRLIKELNKRKETPYTGFTFGNKSITLTELLKITNQTLKDNIVLRSDSVKSILQLKAIKEKFGIAYKETDDKKAYVLENSENSLLKKTKEKEIKINELENKISNMQIGLDFIKKRFGISYTDTGDKISIPYNKIDTLLWIYPLIKDKIKVDKKTGDVYLK